MNSRRHNNTHSRFAAIPNNSNSRNFRRHNQASQEINGEVFYGNVIYENTEIPSVDPSITSYYELRIISEKDVNNAIKDGMPQLTYASLIMMAIRDSPMKKLTLDEIYDYILTIFPYYIHKPKKVCLSMIIHHLCLNDAFIKVAGKPKDFGKRGYWALNKKYGCNYYVDATGKLFREKRDYPVDRANYCSSNQVDFPVHPTNSVSSQPMTLPNQGVHHSAYPKQHTNYRLYSESRNPPLYYQNNNYVNYAEYSGSDSRSVSTSSSKGFQIEWTPTSRNRPV